MATKLQVEALIGKLSDKTLSLGCETSKGTIASYVEFIESNFNSKFCTLLVKVNSTKKTYKLSKIDKVIGLETHTEELSNLKSTTFEKDIGKIKGHPILIGDILEKAPIKFLALSEFTLPLFIRLWMDAGREFDKTTGFNKSLQQIVKATGYEHNKFLSDPATYCKDYDHLVLKTKEANRLFDYLISLFNV